MALSLRAEGCSVLTAGYVLTRHPTSDGIYDL
jgi:hypothetical protein